eukprot:g11470.t1
MFTVQSKGNSSESSPTCRSPGQCDAGTYAISDCPLPARAQVATAQSRPLGGFGVGWPRQHNAKLCSSWSPTRFHPERTSEKHLLR